MGRDRLQSLECEEHVGVKPISIEEENFAYCPVCVALYCDPAAAIDLLVGLTSRLRRQAASEIVRYDLLNPLEEAEDFLDEVELT